MTEEKVKEYIFSFFNKAGDYLDCTSLDENNPTHALYLFQEEFGWGKFDGAYVELIKWDDYELFEDSSNFELSSKVREDARRLCTADPNDVAEIALLKSCPLYEDEDEPTEGGLVVCRYCWAEGFKSVCECKPKEVV